MKVYGYVRVSTSQQDADKQWSVVLNYANDVLKQPIEKIEDTASGKIDWRSRSIGEIIEDGRAGDIIVVSEISRLARSTLGVLELLKVTSEKDIEVHIVQQNLVFKGQGDMTSKIMATMLGMVAEIEREFISQRTKNALAKLKEDGKKLGRPVGSGGKSKLDSRKNEVYNLIKKGLSKTSIARYLEVSTATLYSFLRQNEDLFIQAEKDRKGKSNNSN